MIQFIVIVTTINDGENIYGTLLIFGVGSLGILTFELKQTWDIFVANFQAASILYIGTIMLRVDPNQEITAQKVHLLEVFQL